MKGQNRIVLILTLALWPLGIRAQELEAQTSEDQPISPPPLLNGQAPLLAFQSEKVPTNYLSGGIGFTSAFTDNALLSSANGLGDFGYVIQPHMSFSQATPRLNWYMNLGADVIRHQRFAEENRFAKSVTLDLTYRLSPHASLRLSDSFNDTTGLFAALNPSPSGIGVVEQPNSSLLVPLVQRIVANVSLTELSYQLSANSTVGIRGTFAILDYPGSSPNAQFRFLYPTQTYLVEAFYNHKMSPRQWVGVGLRAQRFNTSVVITDTKSLLLYYSAQTARNLTVSFFAGLESYSLGLVQGQQWTSAEGATLSWQRERTSVVAAFSRQVSDGAGLYPAVILQSANASLRRQLSRGLEAILGFTYGGNDPLQAGNSFHGVSGFCQLQQRLGGNFLLRLGYARQQQQLPGVRTSATANISSVSVSYSFSHVFGTGASTKPAGRLTP